MLLVQLFSSLFYCLKSHKSNSNYRTAVSEKPSTHCTLSLWKFTVQSPRHREKALPPNPSYRRITATNNSI